MIATVLILRCGEYKNLSLPMSLSDLDSLKANSYQDEKITYQVVMDPERIHHTTGDRVRQ